MSNLHSECILLPTSTDAKTYAKTYAMVSNLWKIFSAFLNIIWLPEYILMVESQTKKKEETETIN